MGQTGDSATENGRIQPYRLVKLHMGSEIWEERYATKEEAFTVFMQKRYQEHEGYLIHREEVIYGKKGEIGQVIQRYIGRGKEGRK